MLAFDSTPNPLKTPFCPPEGALGGSVEAHVIVLDQFDHAFEWFMQIDSFVIGQLHECGSRIVDRFVEGIVVIGCSCIDQREQCIGHVVIE